MRLTRGRCLHCSNALNPHAKSWGYDDAPDYRCCSEGCLNHCYNEFIHKQYRIGMTAVCPGNDRGDARHHINNLQQWQQEQPSELYVSSIEYWEKLIREANEEFDKNQRDWIEFARAKLYIKLKAEQDAYNREQAEKQRIAMQKEEEYRRRDQERQAQKEADRLRREADRERQQVERREHEQERRRYYEEKERQRDLKRQEEKDRLEREKEAERQAEEEARRIYPIDPYEALK
jgi:hypothetical protein